MSGLQVFWTGIYTIGLIAFYVTVIAIIPLGARDLRRLLRDLNDAAPEADRQATDAHDA